MPKSFDHPVDRDRRHLGVAVFRKHKACLCRADFCDRSCDRARQACAGRDRRLHGAVSRRYRIDQIGVDEKRRQRQDRRSDLRLIGCQRQHDGGRRTGACRQRVGQCPPHHGRGVVEQHQHRAFGGRGIVRREIGIKVCPRQRAVASARLPAGAVRTQSRKWRTIIGFARARGVRGNGSLGAAALTNRSP